MEIQILTATRLIEIGFTETGRIQHMVQRGAVIIGPIIRSI